MITKPYPRLNGGEGFLRLCLKENANFFFHVITLWPFCFVLGYSKKYYTTSKEVTKIFFCLVVLRYSK